MGRGLGHVTLLPAVWCRCWFVINLFSETAGGCGETRLVRQ